MTDTSAAGSPLLAELRQEGAVAWLTLSRTRKRNAINEDMLDTLLGLLARVRQARDIGVLVLAAQGPAFSAGIDFNSGLAMDSPGATAFDGLFGMRRQHDLIAAVYGLPQVTIAAISGDAIGGGGFGLAMACDLRYAVESARFWMVPTSLHEVQDFGLTWLLQRYAGDAMTLEWVLTGEMIDAGTALRHGLIQQIVPDPDALTALVGAKAAAITATTPDVVKLQKFSLRHGRGSTLDSQLDTEALASALCFRTDDFAEAMAAARARLRKPQEQS
ncbi:MAG TPA: enoyl-CoA hydratase/isomerase family protein [Streptosporangiaceae bacterium]|jgi:enoyl-CoA hydratase/carnithine racemase|nr:enoyl-CoA hydratase/isomerase family protein [Streptosporangiaceae bacterium]